MRKVGMISNDVLRHFGGKIRILGVCLGHQCMGHVYGGVVSRATPVHGKTSLIYHDGKTIFSGLPSPFEAGRYQIDALTLYVSRGIGMEGKGAPRVRFLCPPEIILWENRRCPMTADNGRELVMPLPQHIRSGVTS
jgi:hypothetical protein